MKKDKSRRYFAETMTDAYYADDLALLTKTHAQAESLLQGAGGIGRNVNAKKEFVF